MQECRVTGAAMDGLSARSNHGPPGAIARKSLRVLLKGPVKDKLKRFGLFARLGEETFFPTPGAAFSHLKTCKLDWAD
jgi:hypothetical protein